MFYNNCDVLNALSGLCNLNIKILGKVSSQAGGDESAVGTGESPPSQTASFSFVDQMQPSKSSQQPDEEVIIELSLHTNIIQLWLLNMLVCRKWSAYKSLNVGSFGFIS